MIELIPFVLIGLIVLLGILLILEVQKQVRPQKPKPKAFRQTQPVRPNLPNSPAQKEKVEDSEVGLLFLILGASGLARILSSTTVLANPAASILLVLLIVGIIWYIFNQNNPNPDKPQYQRVPIQFESSDEPISDRPKHQRIPVNPDISDGLSANKPKYQRVPIDHPKRNDWNNRHNKPLPPLKNNDWKSSKRNREPWFNRDVLGFSGSPRQRMNPKQQELLSLLNGDRATAQRLLSHARQSNPGQTETWYFERVISDILRDRR